MKPRPFAKIAAALSAAFLLSACSSIGSLLFGDAETEGQHLYRIGHELAYAQIIVGPIVAHPAADRPIARELCAADQLANEAWAKSLDRFAASGERAPADLAAAAKAIGGLGKAVAGAVVKIPTNPAGVLAKGIEKAPLVLTIAEAGRDARRFRKSIAKPGLAEIVSESRDPTADEWAELRTMIDGQFAEIAAACGL
jgi:hypothetical protein